jgi:hypothetical protein
MTTPTTPIPTPPTLTERDYFVAWLAFFLTATVSGGIAGAIAGGALGFILGAAGVATSVIGRAAAILGFIVSIPISYGVFRWAVGQFLIRRLTPADLPGPGNPPK